MNLLLIILKYAGTAISGAAGIWGTVSETRDKTTGKFTIWGKWALGLAIAGFVVALGAQIAEQTIANEEKQEAKQKAQENENHLQKQLDLAQQQLALAQTTSDFVESEKTRFNIIRVTVTFQFSVTDPRIRNVVNDCGQLATQTSLLARHPSGITRNAKSLEINPNLIDLRLMKSLEPLTNFFRALSDTSMAVQISRHAQSSDANASAPNKPARTDLNAPFKVSTNKYNPALIYDFESHQLTVSLSTFDFPSDSWRGNGNIIGIRDLAGATMTLSFMSPSQGNKIESSLESELKLAHGRAFFGTFSCPLTSFSPRNGSRPPRSLDTSYQTVLPDADKILR